MPDPQINEPESSSVLDIVRRTLRKRKRVIPHYYTKSPRAARKKKRRRVNKNAVFARKANRPDKGNRTLPVRSTT